MLITPTLALELAPRYYKLRLAAGGPHPYHTLIAPSLHLITHYYILITPLLHPYYTLALTTPLLHPYSRQLRAAPEVPPPKEFIKVVKFKQGYGMKVAMSRLPAKCGNCS